MTFRLDPAARDEYLAAALHYLDESPRIAAAFVDQIEAGIARIRENPMIWRTIDEEVRRYLVRQFPFGIYYTIEGDEIAVWAIMDLRRRPGYWRERRR
jgi:plasmid stabilization system protein ParE